MARICGICKTEKMFTLTRGDETICVDCHNKKVLSPQAGSEAVSAEFALLDCPFCGEEIRPFRTYRMKWAVVHSCESGLKIEISSRKKKEVLEILAKRAI